jgi:hypothetical protein
MVPVVSTDRRTAPGPSSRPVGRLRRELSRAIVVVWPRRTAPNFEEHTMSITASDHPSTLTRVQQFLGERRGLRYVLLGVVLMIVAVPQMFVAGSTASTGHFILAGIGIALIAAGTVTGIVKAHHVDARP